MQVGVFSKVVMRMEGYKTIDDMVVAVGRKAVKILRDYLVGSISSEEVVKRLQELGARDIYYKYWDSLSGDPRLAHHHEILQLITALEMELPLQEKELGKDSLMDDLKELIFALEKIGKSNL